MKGRKRRQNGLSCDLMNMKVQNSNYSEKREARGDSQGLSVPFVLPRQLTWAASAWQGLERRWKIFSFRSEARSLLEPRESM